MHVFYVLAVYSVIVILCFGGGFAAGRVKNLEKLKIFHDHINAIEAVIGNDANVASSKIRALIDALRKKL